MDLATRRRFSLAFQDILEGTRVWRTWYVLGVSELRQKYRRSMLGPFWVALTVGIQALVMGFLLAFLFQVDVNRQLPFICISIVTWNFISTSINEGANCFIALATTILQVRRPLWTYMMLILWRNAIIYGHTILVFFIVAAIFRIYPSFTWPLAVPGLALLVANVGWMALASGLLSVRYRDVPLLVQNLFTVLVWMTPVYYEPNMLGSRTRMVIELNPLTHVIEVARAPFLNEVLSSSVWLAAAGVALFGWLFTLALFARTRARVPFWL